VYAGQGALRAQDEKTPVAKTNARIKNAFFIVKIYLESRV
jgi:hypothetical protein